MDINTLILIVVTVAFFALGIFVLLQNKKRSINWIYALLSMSVAGWSLTNAMFQKVNSLDKAIFWARWSDVSAIFLVFFLFVFSWLFPKKVKDFNKYIKYLVYCLTTIILLVLAFFPALIREKVIFIDIYNNQKQIITGSLFYIFAIYILIIIMISFAIIIKKYYFLSGIYRLQIRYYSIGVLCTAVFGVIFNLFFPLVGNYKFVWLGPDFALMFLLSVAYSITRYRFMDIKSIVFRSIVFSFFVLLLTSVYVIISVVISSYFENMAGVESSIIAGLIISIMVVFGYQSLLRLIEKLTEAFLFKKTYNPNQLVSNISDVTSSILDLHQLLASVINILSDSFHSEKIAMALLDKEGKLSVAYHQGFEDSVINNFAKGKEKVLPLYFRSSHEIQVIDELKARYEAGEYQPKSVELLMGLTQLDIALVVPLFVQERLIGIFVIGNKKSGDPYNKQDLSVLKIISNQAGIAIENASLYDEMKDFNVKLEDEVRKKTTELQKANDELRQLDAAKSEFISIASHQLRTPLTVIKGYVSMMQEGSFGEIPPKILENLNKIYVSNERLIGLVENLLDISRIESGRQEYNWTKIHLEDLAQTVVDNMKNNAKDKNVKLFFHKPKIQTPEVLVDANKLHEVMMNFVDNSLKYTKEGKIDVYITNDTKENMVNFYVKDTGMGISPEIKNSLFKKFSRGKDSFRIHTEGVGLGLYVAKMLIDAHQGKIWAESDGVGKGSAFYFSIPLNRTDVKETPPMETFPLAKKS